MKLESQICTLEQAKILSRLGIIQGCSLFFYDSWSKELLPKFNSSHKEGHYKDAESCFSAFTVSELGCMLGKGTKSSELYWQYMLDMVNAGVGGTIAFNVVALAGHVITQIENGTLAVGDANNWLINS
jgi:hypothetical protein